MTEPFDVCGPLPTGVTVLEASAGTGKTWTIAALAARYVAEGTPLEQLLLVTFTRMATGELRDRVRERLVGTEQALARVLIGEPPADDPLVELLARENVAQRRDNLARALANFDAATIATIHGFCQEVLGGLGVAGDVEGELVEDPTDLVDEVVDDLYVRKFRHEDRPAITRAEAGRVARIAVDNPIAPIEPRDAPDDTLPAMRRRLADAVRTELAVRKLRAGVLTYDDLLIELNKVLQGDRGEEIAQRLRARWKVVLVDEFQDTDPVQWSIMRRAFGTGTLVLIGDPKQAIYAFRGADVYAYLDAKRTAAAHATLDVNRRSDQALIDAYDALFAGARLGHEGIVYRTVRAARAGRGMPGPPLRIRVVERGDVRSTARGYAELPSVREHVAKDVAADLVRLLSGGEAKPADVAVLVQTNRNAARVRDALDAAGIPAVINGAGSVFGTVEAEEWLRLLEALERPTSDLRARSAALTPFLGWSAERVAAAGDPEWEDVHRRLHDWARVLRLRGVASLMETITLAEGLPARVLSSASGERRLTDLRHVGELLHAEQLGTTALTGWLRRRIAEAGWDTGDEDRSRRLESDADAVQVLTVHRSKGLEFGVVYYPDLFEPGYIPKDVPGDVPRRGRRADDRRRHERLRLRPSPRAVRGRAARRGSAHRLRRAHARASSGRPVVGPDLRQPRLVARPPAVRTRRRRDHPGRRPQRADGHRRMAAVRAARGRRARLHRRRALAARPAARLVGRAARACRAHRRALRPRARPALAPHLVHGPGGRRPRGAGRKRARGDRDHRRAGGPRGGRG